MHNIEAINKYYKTDVEVQLKTLFLAIKSKKKQTSSEEKYLLKRFKYSNQKVIRFYKKNMSIVMQYNKYLEHLNQLKKSEIKVKVPEAKKLLPKDITAKHILKMKSDLNKRRNSQIIEVKNYRGSNSKSAEAKLRNKNTSTNYPHETLEERLLRVNIGTTDLYGDPYVYETMTDKTIIRAEEYLNMKLHNKSYHKTLEFYFDRLILDNRKVVFDENQSDLKKAGNIFRLQGWNNTDTMVLNYIIYHRKFFSSEEECIQYFTYNHKVMPKADFIFNQKIGLFKNLITFSEALEKTGQSQYTRDAILRYIISSPVVDKHTFKQFCNTKER